MTTKAFCVGDVLSIVTGKLLSPRGMDGVYEILNHMTGGNLFTHQLPRAAETCGPVLLSIFPQLASEDPSISSEGELNFYLAEVIAKYGDVFEVPQLEQGVYERKSPLVEYYEMVKG